MENEKNVWFLFIMSQPGKSTTPRIRLWRLLKGLGAAVLRDGVYLLPQRETLQQALEEQVQGVQTLGGAAYVLAVEPVTATDAHFRALFDRSEEYAALLTTVSQLRATLAETTEAPARRVLQQVRREYEAMVAIDYFAGAAFTHTGHRVTFEVLVASFDLGTDQALARLGVLVHALDVGGVPVPEAAGFEAILTGVRASGADDDQVLAAMMPVLDALYTAFGQETP